MYINYLLKQSLPTYILFIIQCIPNTGSVTPPRCPNEGAVCVVWCGVVWSAATPLLTMPY
jgi:hypothetical protein